MLDWPMKKILINAVGQSNGRLFDPEARDGVCDHWIYLRDRLRRMGYDLETTDDRPVDDAEWIWFFDAIGVPEASWRDTVRQAVFRSLFWPEGRDKGRPHLFKECVKAGLQDRVALFIREPPTVWPRNWDTRVHELFPIIMTWSDLQVDGKRFYKYYDPITHRFPNVQDVQFHKRKLLVNISSNKSSSHPRELYSARRQTIRYFEENHQRHFDLYGVGWNDSYPSYRGTIRHKWGIFPNYRFGLCYENMRDEPGYITEKIFDCMRAGCVPVYWGAPNVTDVVDPDAFVDRRQFKTDQDLADYLLSVSEDEWESRRQAIRQYLETEKFTRFTSPAFADTIIRVFSL
jgi:hypothetical protein